MKFKNGDKIVVTEFGRGFENATVTGIIKQNGKQYYTLKIPISAEVNYKLLEE